MRVLLLLIVVALNIGLWTLANRPHGVAPPRGEKVHSLSFAPFRDGQSPLTGVYASPQQIEEDVVLLKDRTERVRLYTSLEGMEIVTGGVREELEIGINASKRGVRLLELPAAILQFALHTAAFADIAENKDGTGQFAVRDTNGRGTVVDGNLASVESK